MTHHAIANSQKSSRVQGRTNHSESKISDTCWDSFSHSDPKGVGEEGPSFHPQKLFPS